MTLMTRSDPFTLQILHNALVSAAEEMFTTTARTAKSPIIYDVLDFSTAITDPQGNVTAQATGIPLFIGVFDYTVKGVLGKFGSNLHPGDVVILNDPYISGTHLNDVGLVMPIFYEDSIVAIAASKGHWNDIGGMHFGSWGPGTTEIYQEGLQIPPVKVYVEGRANKDIIDIIRQNSRIPDHIMGDMEAQIAGLKVAAKRVEGMITKYGLNAYMEAIQKIQHDGQAIAKARLKQLPKGTFEASDFLDEGGPGDELLPITVRVEISEENFKVDFTHNAKQLAASINTTYPGTVASVRVVYVALIDPHVRYNQGLVAPLEVVVPEGTIFNAVRPAPVSVYWETLTYAADLVWKAIAPHAPDKLTAGHFLSVVAEIIAGIDDRTKEPFALVEPNPGGWGAGIGKDGESGLVSFADGETFATSAEVIEIRYPIMVERYQLNTEDGVGHGKFRGGFGIVKDYRILNNEAEFTTDINRARVEPWAVDGGMKGTLNYILLNASNRPSQRVRKIASFKLKKGDLVSIRTGGGGGWGKPREREPVLVVQDVRNGLLTVEQARDVYGVAMDSDTWSVKEEETRALRQKQRA